MYANCQQQPQAYVGWVRSNPALCNTTQRPLITIVIQNIELENIYYPRSINTRRCTIVGLLHSIPSAGQMIQHRRLLVHTVAIQRKAITKITDSMCQTPK